MPENSPSALRYLTPGQVAELLAVSVDEVVALVHEGRLRGAQLGSPPRWRVEEESVNDYLEDQTEVARRAALWHQSENASFPEVWSPAPRITS